MDQTPPLIARVLRDLDRGEGEPSFLTNSQRDEVASACRRIERMRCDLMHKYMDERTRSLPQLKSQLYCDVLLRCDHGKRRYFWLRLAMSEWAKSPAEHLLKLFDARVGDCLCVSNLALKEADRGQYSAAVVEAQFDSHVRIVRRGLPTTKSAAASSACGTALHRTALTTSFDCCDDAHTVRDVVYRLMDAQRLTRAAADHHDGLTSKRWKQEVTVMIHVLSVVTRQHHEEGNSSSLDPLLCSVEIFGTDISRMGVLLLQTIPVACLKTSAHSAAAAQEGCWLRIVLGQVESIDIDQDILVLRRHERCCVEIVESVDTGIDMLPRELCSQEQRRFAALRRGKRYYVCDDMSADDGHGAAATVLSCGRYTIEMAYVQLPERHHVEAHKCIIVQVNSVLQSRVYYMRIMSALLLEQPEAKWCFGEMNPCRLVFAMAGRPAPSSRSHLNAGVMEECTQYDFDPMIVWIRSENAMPLINRVKLLL